MRIKNFSIENFKVFNQRTDFEFAPITLLTGPNNSGKSSLTKGIASLLESRKKDVLSGLELYSSIIPLGDFDVIKNKNNNGKSIKMSLQLYPDLPFELVFTFIKSSLFVPFAVLEKLEILHDNKTLFLFQDWVGGGSYYEASVHVENYLEYLQKSKGSCFYELQNTIISRGIEIGFFNIIKFDFSKSIDKYVSTLLKIPDAIKTERGKEYLKKGFQQVLKLTLSNKQEVEILSQIEKLIALASGQMCDCLKTLDFHGFETSYSPINKGNIKMDYQFNSDDTLLERIINTKINSEITYMSDDSSFLNLPATAFVKKWLNYFSIGNQVIIKKTHGLNYQIFIKSKNGRLIPISDLGYGVAGLIVLVLSICEFRFRGLRIIEEPETNLHPAFQSKLADLFSKIITEEENQQLLIETHSEYLIRKFQYLIAQGEMKPEDIIIYYFHDPNNIPKGEKHIKKITIGKDGRLSQPFGPGFFDETDRLLNGLITGEKI